MPQEIGRTTAFKYIALPGGVRVPVPVITKINFIDASDRHWETQYTIDNTKDSSRQVHVDQVRPSQDANPDDVIDVERIDVWPVLDSTDRAQETQVTIDNVTGADDVPPHFRTHLKTHVVRYYENPAIVDDTKGWVDVEVIDQLDVVDASDRHQETILYLDWKDEQADLSDPDITGSDTIDPPYRIDPFSNIIDFNGNPQPEDTGALPFSVVNGGRIYGAQVTVSGGHFEYSLAFPVNPPGSTPTTGTFWAKPGDPTHGANIFVRGTVSFTPYPAEFNNAPGQSIHVSDFSAQITGAMTVVINADVTHVQGNTTAILDLSDLEFIGRSPNSMHDLILVPTITAIATTPDVSPDFPGSQIAFGFTIQLDPP